MPYPILVNLLLVLDLTLHLLNLLFLLFLFLLTSSDGPFQTKVLVVCTWIHLYLELWRTAAFHRLRWSGVAALYFGHDAHLLWDLLNFLRLIKIVLILHIWWRFVECFLRRCIIDWYVV